MFGALASALENSWTPLPGRQTEAYTSPADCLFYGGAAGGGKSDLLLGLAHTSHRRSILFRRQYRQLSGLEDRSRELFGSLGDYNSAKNRWTLRDGRIIEFGGVDLPGSEQSFQGRPHDLIGFDELPHFLESQFRFLIAWLRTTDPNQRCRIVATGNPPTDATGDWVIRYWAPWLDEQHPNPAQPGELRWFATIDGKDVELESGEPFEHDGEQIIPMSRTFIPAKITDNPYLLNTGYKTQLQSLPEPLRSLMLEGNFGVTQEDDIWQIIPTAWVKAAQARWTPDKPDIPMTALGVDVARGGKDRTVLSPRHGNWYGPQVCTPGSATPNGQAVVKLILDHREGNAAINMDIIGVGGGPMDVASMHGITITPMNGSAASHAKDRSGRLTFVNKRAEWWWKMREALDPSSGEDLALPPDRELLADLTAPRWKLMQRGIQVEAKEEIKERIGRSPDKGDSLVYASATGSAAGWIAFYARLASRIEQGLPIVGDMSDGEQPKKESRPVFNRSKPAAPPRVTLKTTAHRNFFINSHRYCSDENGLIRDVDPKDADELLTSGGVRRAEESKT